MYVNVVALSTTVNNVAAVLSFVLEIKISVESEPSINSGLFVQSRIIEPLLSVVAVRLGGAPGALPSKSGEASDIIFSYLFFVIS